MDINSYFLFITASILLCISPGPDMIYLLGRSIAQGKRAGVLAALGINLGAYVHLLAAILGLTAILAASSMAFFVIKWIGVMYLVYLGIRFLFSKQQGIRIDAEGREVLKGREIFCQGFLSDVLNPKVALFYLAFLPQFVVPDTGKLTSQLLVLGITLNIVGIVSNIAIVYLSVIFTNGLRQNRRLSRYLSRMLGGVFVALGLRLASEKI